MKPFIVLLTGTLLALMITRWVTGAWQWQLAARIGLSMMLVFTAIGHFAYTKGMAMMLPPAVPFKVALVYITGILETGAGLLLLLPAFTAFTGWFLIVFFILLLPANIYAAIHHINYQTGSLDGPGLSYLWFRVPMQLVLIAWAYYVAVF
ncbi:Uncharacterized membrane protein [Filimonas lacunae]|uniref:Uncharacterized membrane protein n=1 Tax=Filimonas lacunae TaxID=477680 RepID=A0A173ML62_9BACT|nr:hypothetical protein [Filimonas lacunae]BAV08344.1 hypothetical protein FLA_4380 [Filimonas lacunae]SIT33429.1 Uncharacterized membrane protein [Filimonas lacunae]